LIIKKILLYIVFGGHFAMTPNIKHIDPILFKYVDRFQFFYGKNINFEVSFDDLENPMTDRNLGFCSFITGSKFRLVKINRKLWKTLGEYGKEQLIFHELGHCELNRNHENSYTDHKIPKSIMYYVGFGDMQYYFFNRGYYIKELFSKKYDSDNLKNESKDDDIVIK
jgi:hypothetical protein